MRERKTKRSDRFVVKKATCGSVYFVEELETRHIAASFNSNFVPAAERRAQIVCDELNQAVRS